MKNISTSTLFMMMAIISAKPADEAKPAEDPAAIGAQAKPLPQPDQVTRGSQTLSTDRQP